MLVLSYWFSKDPFNYYFFIFFQINYTFLEECMSSIKVTILSVIIVSWELGFEPVVFRKW